MANSKITLNINAPLELGDTIALKDSNTPSVIMYIDFDGSSLTPSGEIITDTQNIYNYINNTYNSLNRYDMLWDFTPQTKVIIEDKLGGVLFSEFINDTGGRITTTIENVAPPVLFEIDNITFQENATNPCGLFDMLISTNETATSILSPIQQPVNENPFLITGIPKGAGVVEVEKSGDTDSKTYNVPVINSAYFSLDFSVNPNGSTVTVNYPSISDSDYTTVFEYSLNGVDYTNSSSFSGLSDGNYTMYIRDSVGCYIEIPFNIEFTPNVYKREPFFKISQQNSLVNVLRQDTNNCGIFKNTSNTLSFEEETSVNNQSFKQLFQKCDGVITQQYKSNYDNVEVKLIDCSGNETILDNVVKSSNLDVTDVREVNLSEVTYNGSQFVGVYYGSGKTYDPTTLEENGSYYLGNSVPEFMNVDDSIYLDGFGWYSVKDIVFIDNLQYLVLDVLVANFSGGFIPDLLEFKVTAIYNKLPYEVYEYNIDLSSLNGDYYITTKATDSEFTEINYRTEWFNVSDIQLNTYVLDYYNSVNNETNYSTGIRNRIRIKYANTLTHSPNDTQDVYLTDTNAVLTEAEYRDFYTLDIMPIPVNFARKIGLAVSNDRLFLNGLSLLKNSELEQERVGVSNLYRLKIQFVQSDYVFTSISEDSSNVGVDRGEVLGTDNNINIALGVKEQ